MICIIQSVCDEHSESNNLTMEKAGYRKEKRHQYNTKQEWLDLCLSVVGEAHLNTNCKEKNNYSCSESAPVGLRTGSLGLARVSISFEFLRVNETPKLLARLAKRLLAFPPIALSGVTVELETLDSVEDEAEGKARDAASGEFRGI